MNAWNSAGFIERGSTPWRSSCSFMDAVSRARAISAEIFETMLFGVRAGATIPHHDMALKPGELSATAGTLGSAVDRFGLVTPIAFNRPAFTCGTTASALAKLIEIWLEMRSTMAGPVPLYGTWTMSMPKAVPNITPERCCELPMPFEP